MPAFRSPAQIRANGTKEQDSPLNPNSRQLAGLVSCRCLFAVIHCSLNQQPAHASWAQKYNFRRSPWDMAGGPSAASRCGPSSVVRDPANRTSHRSTDRVVIADHRTVFPETASPAPGSARALVQAKPAATCGRFPRGPGRPGRSRAGAFYSVRYLSPASCYRSCPFEF